MKPRIIAVVNHKGGVGKTTTTLNLGKALSLLKKKVLIVDTDPQANLSQSVGVEEPPKNIYHALVEGERLPIEQVAKGLHLVPADLDLSGAEVKLITEVNGYFKLRNTLGTVAKNYDYILIDCPPSLGILTANAMIAATEVLIVVQSQYLAIKGLDTIIELIEELRQNLNPALGLMGLLLTQVNRTVVSRTIVEKVQTEYGDAAFQTVIRQNVAVVESSTHRMDIFSYDKECAAAQDYLNLAKEIVNG